MRRLPTRRLSYEPSQQSTAVPGGLTRYFDQVYGIGTSLEASTSWNMNLLAPPQRATLLKDLFDPEAGVGFSVARITIATSDFTPLPFYSYADDGPDPHLATFNVSRDEAYILPAIHDAITAAGGHGRDTLRLFASPWSAPGWMKDSGSMLGGSLLPEYNSVYATYLLRFLQAYHARGVAVDAITIQNEPLQNDSK